MTPHRCWLGGNGESHPCTCVTKGGETLHCCTECRERGCDERRRRAHYAATIKPGLKAYGASV